ncbi:MAG TPA: mitochondrial fission ELM1 family protein [Stellaceae bacterium]|nr:mitochondrial fission ELM1 family protein [Stellaceae bacterium]
MGSVTSRNDASAAGIADAPVWVLHDGKVGLRNQVIGVAEAVGLPFTEKRLEIRWPWRALPPSLWYAALNAPGGAGDRLLPPWPRLVIAAGGRAAAPALAIRRAAGACLAVQIQDPKLSARRFDLMIVPEHDRLRGPNVLLSRGAVHRVTAAKLDEARIRWAPRFAHLPRPLVAVLIGGGNGSYGLAPERMAAITADLARLAQRDGAGLLITPSRRTGPEAERILRTGLAGLPAEIWDGAGENPYFGYLALADAILATEDSVSMISEAAATGKPVHVIRLDGGSAKFRRFHAAMYAAGITRDFTGQLSEWEYAVRDDTAIAAAAIRARMEECRLWP